MSFTWICSLPTRMQISLFTLVGATSAAVLFIAFGHFSSRRKTTLFQINRAHSNRWKKTGQTCFAVAFLPMGLILAASFDLQKFWNSIVPDGVLIVALCTFLIALWKRIDHDISLSKDRILYSVCGLLSGMIIELALKSICMMS